MRAPKATYLLTSLGITLIRRAYNKSFVLIPYFQLFSFLLWFSCLLSQTTHFRCTTFIKVIFYMNHFQWFSHKTSLQNVKKIKARSPCRFYSLIPPRSILYASINPIQIKSNIFIKQNEKITINNLNDKQVHQDKHRLADEVNLTSPIPHWLHQTFALLYHHGQSISRDWFSYSTHRIVYERRSFWFHSE